MKGCRGVSDGDSGLRGREGVSDGRFWVEVTRESFRWRILGEGARGSSSRSTSAVSKSLLLFRHLPSSGFSANAEHSWLEHPTPTAHHPQRFATHDPSPQTMGLAGVFEFAKNSWQEAESRSTLSIAGHPQGARCLPCCHRAACASEASWPRMTAMEADAGGAGWEACQMDCIPPSASVLFPVSSKKLKKVLTEPEK